MEYAVTCVVGIELKQPRQAKAADGRHGIEPHVEDAMRELEHRWISESKVDVDLARSEASFLVVVEAGDRQRAMSKAWGVLSMAVHAAGGATSHRPFPWDAAWSVRLLSAKASPRAKEDRAAAFA
ncbi:MAG: hypothetical protein ACLP36_02945 [Acidimicrobiales bacterium]|jgi:hypothetical protein